MGYELANGRFANTRDLGINDANRGLVPAGTVVAVTGNGTWIEIGDRSTLRLVAAVSAASGTSPTLDLTVETSFDAGVTDAARSLGTFAQKTGVASERKTFTGADRWVRVRPTVGGTTPSFTYGVTGEAV